MAAVLTPATYNLGFDVNVGSSETDNTKSGFTPIRLTSNSDTAATATANGVTLEIINAGTNRDRGNTPDLLLSDFAGRTSSRSIPKRATLSGLSDASYELTTLHFDQILVDMGRSSESMEVQVTDANGTVKTRVFDWLADENERAQTFKVTVSGGNDIVIDFISHNGDTTRFNGLRFSRIEVNLAPEITELNSSYVALESKSGDGVVFIDGRFSDSDLSDSHSVTVDWGDGSVSQTVAVNQQEDTFAANHTYVNTGINTVTVTVEDGSGGIASKTTTLVGTGVGLVDGTLYVIGTDSADEVNIKLSRAGDTLKVKTKLNKAGSDGGSDAGSDKTRRRSNGGNVDFFDLADVERIVMYLRDGDDKVKINKKVMINAEIHGEGGNDKITTGGGNDLIFGGLGNDKMKAGYGNDVVVGGAGNDRLSGGSDGGSDGGPDGGDILIGGVGRDKLKGGKGNNLLVGGTSAIEDDVDALNAAFAMWLADNSDIFGFGFADDGEKDKLKGGKGSNILIRDTADKVKKAG